MADGDRVAVWVEGGHEQMGAEDGACVIWGADLREKLRSVGNGVAIVSLGSNCGSDELRQGVQ